LEGADLSGKSYLATKLAEDPSFINFSYFKIKERFLDDWMKYIDFCAEVEYNCIVQLQDILPYDIILNRSYISSLIYEKVYQRKYDMSYIKESDIISKVIFYVTVPKEILCQRAMQRTEDKTIIDKLFILHDEYEKFFNEFKYDFVKLDGNANLEENIEIIYDTMLKAKENEQQRVGIRRAQNANCCM
jgi:thymidylate kinase